MKDFGLLQQFRFISRPPVVEDIGSECVESELDDPDVAKVQAEQGQLEVIEEMTGMKDLVLVVQYCSDAGMLMISTKSPQL